MSSNSFTNDDLKRLKEIAARYRNLVITGNDIPSISVPALLARLEAAESYIDGIEINGFDDPDTSKLGNNWRNFKLP